MFALEEASTFWTIKMTLRCFFVSMVAGLVIFSCTAIEEHDWYIYNMVRFGNFINDPMSSLGEIPVLALLGVLCGLLGTCWNMLAKKIMIFRF